MTSTLTPTRAAITPGKQRIVARIVHLIAAALLGTFVHAPADLAEPLRVLLQFVVIPAAAATGLLLWKQATIRRLFRNRRRTRSAARG